MFQFKVDNQLIAPNTVWYHYQKNPRPGGHFYLIQIPKDSESVKTIERLVEATVGDTDFCEKASAFNDSTFNCVQVVLNDIPEEDQKKWHVKWVFNTIDRVRVVGDEVWIEGRCSEVVENFGPHVKPA